MGVQSAAVSTHFYMHGPYRVKSATRDVHLLFFCLSSAGCGFYINVFVSVDDFNLRFYCFGDGGLRFSFVFFFILTIVVS